MTKTLTLTKVRTEHESIKGLKGRFNKIIWGISTTLGNLKRSEGLEQWHGFMIDNKKVSLLQELLFKRNSIGVFVQKLKKKEEKTKSES